MSTTTSGAPPAATEPATRKLCQPVADCSDSESPDFNPSAAIAAGFRNTASGAKTLAAPASDPGPVGSGLGIKPGAIAATFSASTPTIRSAMFALPTPAPSRRPWLSISSTGLTNATDSSSASPA